MLRCYEHYHRIQNCLKDDNYPRWFRVDRCQSDFVLSGAVAENLGFVR